MKKHLLISLLTFVYLITIHAQAVYIDSNIGNDNNTGTEKSPVFSINKAAEIIKSKDNNFYVIKLNPGIYILDKHVSISTEKDLTNKRIVIEASILPDDTSWTPDKMPVIVSKAKKGEIPEDYNFVASLLIDESYVTIKGIKFLGNFYPNTRYFPIARFNKVKSDLLVEQCMFVGDEHASPIQVGIIAHGDKINVDHCIFYNVRNATVYWQDSGNGLKTGNSLTNCIVFGAYVSAIWTSDPDKDFIFKNNIVSNCNLAWIKNSYNTTKYSMDSCVIVNNKYYQGNENRVSCEFAIEENNVIKEGKILLQLINNIDTPLPINYLHIIPNTLGYNLGAGLFKSKKTLKF
ncbi:MAG: hypothetical protein V1720_13010 [bacterium]